MKHPYTDFIEMNRIMKITYPNGKDIDSINSLYRTYINSQAPDGKIGCNCSGSLANYYETLRDWFVKNGDLFQTEEEIIPPEDEEKTTEID